MERYIAIDRQCLWPVLTKFDDGAIGVLGFNEPCHAIWPGDQQAWVSRDGGRIWEKRGIPVPRGEGEVRAGGTSGLGLDGSWICCVTGHGNWTAPPPKPGPHENADTVLLDFWDTVTTLVPTVARSDDQGLSWKNIGELPLSESGKILVPFGRIDTGADGALRMFAYSSVKTRERSGWESFFLRSSDGGITWNIQSVLPSKGCNETACIHLGGGHWMAAARRHQPEGGEMLVGFSSKDDGATWTEKGTLGAHGSFPACFVQWKNRLILLYGNRAIANRGIDLRYYDEKKGGWTMPRRLIDLQGDMGYPTSVVNDSDELVVAYYASYDLNHFRYHMGVAIPKPAEIGLEQAPLFGGA